MQAVAVFLWDTGLIWLLLPIAAAFLRSIALAIGCYVTFLGVGWATEGGSLAIGLTMLAIGVGLVIYGLCNRW